MGSQRTPAGSAGLITAERPAAFPPADGRALAVAASMVVVSMAVADAARQSFIPAYVLIKEFENGEEHHASQNFEFCPR